MQRTALIALSLVALALAGCSSKGGSTAPAQEFGDWSVEGRVLRWTTGLPARATVLYGSTPGEYDHVAYPAAAGRADRGYRTSHEISLLDLRDGEAVYFRLGSELVGQPDAPYFSAEHSFTAGTGPAPDQLVSTLIHVGWGDAHLVEFPGGKRLVIDAGEGDAARSVAEFLGSRGISGIDAAMATHVHFDHIGGMSTGGSYNVLEDFAPAVYFDSPPKAYYRTAYVEGVLPRLSELGIDRVVLERGDSDLSVPELVLDPDVRIHVLNSGLGPGVPSTDSNEGNVINNESIVLRFSYGDVDFVIGGDAELPAEQSMLAAFLPEELDVEMYKAHHHGRNDGSSRPWLNALRPRVSLVPVEVDQYDGPAGSWDAFLGQSGPVLERLEAAGADPYIVDHLPQMRRPYHTLSGRNFNLSFATDGVSFEVRAELATQASARAGHGAPAGAHHDCDHGHPQEAPR